MKLFLNILLQRTTMMIFGVLRTKKKKRNLISSLNIKTFSLDELQKSLSKAHDIAYGPDHIHYKLLKHSADSFSQDLLDLMNDLWES